MGEGSKIEWTHHTFNPWVGCSKVSPACDNCYAETWAKRSGMVEWGAQRRRTSHQNWRQPLKWQASIPDGERRRVFCASLADIFDNQVPPEWRSDLWELIGKTPHLDWLLLTKRIGNVARMLPQDWGAGYANAWLGVSVANQEEADRDVPKLIETPAAVRFLSCEPLLGPISLFHYDEEEGALRGPGVRVSGGVTVGTPNEPPEGYDDSQAWIDWVIVGGESGPRARPMMKGWALALRAQCRQAGVAYFFKQGSQANWCGFKDFASFPSELQVREWPQPGLSVAP